MKTTFQITLSPMRREDCLILSVKEDALILNGKQLDLSGVPEGSSVAPSDLADAGLAADWLAGEIRRTDGVLHLTLMLPLGADAPQEARFPAPLTVSKAGPVALPGQDTPAPATNLPG